VPLTGYVLQRGAAGIYPDLWASSSASLEIRPLAPVSGLLLRGWRPDTAPPTRLQLSAAGVTVEAPIAGGSFETPIKFPDALTEPFTLSIETEAGARAVDQAVDARDLVFILSELRTQHPLVQAFAKILG
jgi:hypothetical protein